MSPSSRPAPPSPPNPPAPAAPPVWSGQAGPGQAGPGQAWPGQTGAAPVGASGRFHPAHLSGADPATTAPPAETTSARLVRAVRAGLSGTPGRMRVVLVVAAVCAIVFGLVTSQAFRQTDGALSRADANTAQLVRVQAIHTTLVRANATATNAFLVGGLEPADQRADYTAALAEATRLIAEAAEKQPADAAALGALNTTVLAYAGLVEQARANNRQGLPVGAQYLRDASTLLRTDALPVLDALVGANSSRLDQEFDRVDDGAGWLRWIGLLTVLALTGVLIWLARRTHRYLNLPLAGAGALVLVTILTGGAALSGVAGTAADVRDGPYAATLALARARIAAYDARSNESLTLIARGSGATFEDEWKKSATTVGDQLGVAARLTASAAGLPDAWRGYTEVHEKIRTTDDGGRWDEAVTLSVGASPGSARTVFGAFDTASAAALADTSETTRAELQDAGGWLAAAGWLGLLAGALAAGLAWRGVSQRLEEYR